MLCQCYCSYSNSVSHFIIILCITCTVMHISNKCPVSMKRCLRKTLHVITIIVASPVDLGYLCKLWSCGLALISSSSIKLPAIFLLIYLVCRVFAGHVQQDTRYTSLQIYNKTFDMFLSVKMSPTHTYVYIGYRLH